MYYIYNIILNNYVKHKSNSYGNKYISPFNNTLLVILLFKLSLNVIIFHTA